MDNIPWEADRRLTPQDIPHVILTAVLIKIRYSEMKHHVI
jgi:hypothetical protein